MRECLPFILLLALVCSASAIDLGTSAPPKALSNAPVNVPTRQGGDTILDAVSIALPYSGTGSTSGFADDYDEVCPYADSTAPDVVYTFIPVEDVSLDINMLGSGYDTKISTLRASPLWSTATSMSTTVAVTPREALPSSTSRTGCFVASVVGTTQVATPTGSSTPYLLMAC